MRACSWRLHRNVAESVDALLGDINRQGAAAQGMGALQAAAPIAEGGGGGLGGRSGPAAGAAGAGGGLGPVTEVRWYERGGAGRMMVAFEGAEAERRALEGGGAAGWGGGPAGGRGWGPAGRTWLAELLARVAEGAPRP